MIPSRYEENLELLARPEVQGMLRAIRNAEGTDNDKGYNTRVGYQYFGDLSKKPGKRVWIPSIKDYSTAEGAYQFLNSTWDGVARDLGIKDFSKNSQDVAAVELLRRNGSLERLMQGDFEGAVHKSASTWASLPTEKGQGYYGNQRAKDINNLKRVFLSDNEGYTSSRYPEAGKDYLDSTVNLKQGSGAYDTASEYEEPEEDQDEVEGNEAKQELLQAQQEKDFLQELQAQQEQPQTQYQQNDPSAYELYVPELPELPGYTEQPQYQTGGDYFNENINKDVDFPPYNTDSEDYRTAMQGMMKSKMAMQATLGNKGAKRMMSHSPEEYIFTGKERDTEGEPYGVPYGATGTHFMANADNYVFPLIQDRGDKKLYFNNNASVYDREAMQFETPEEADYFARNYKDVAPMMQKYEEGGDFVETYMDTEEGLTEEKPPKDIKNIIPKFDVKDYKNKENIQLKESPREFVKSTISNTQKPVDRKIQRYQNTIVEQSPLKKEIREVNRELANKATLEDSIENKDIDLNLKDYKNKEQVKKLQSFLVEKGYNLNPEGKFKDNGIDGQAGKVTLTAIQQYNQNLSNNGYYSIKNGSGLLGKCTEGQCSEYSQNELFRNIQPNMTRDEWNAKTGLTGNAWDIGKNIVSKGGKEVESKQVKPGDVVTMFTGGRSLYQGEANAAGTGTTHVGIVDKVNPDGSYYILHNVHSVNMKGDYEGKEFRDLVKDNSIVSSTNTGFQVKHAFRPKYEAVENGEKKIIREDLNIKINPKKAKILQTGEYSNFFTNSSAKDKLEKEYIKPLNDSRNKQVLSKVFNLGDDEYSSLAKASLGILGQETSFGTSGKYTTGVKEGAAKISKAASYIPTATGINELSKAAIGKNLIKTDEVSKGAGQLKYETNFGEDDLTEIGITKDNFNDENKASLTTMYKLSRDYKKFLNKGFSKKDAIYRAITNYNSSMGRVVKGKRTEDYAKDYDVDYTNKVLQYSDIFDIQDDKKTYKTTSDNLLVNENVARWREALKKAGKV